MSGSLTIQFANNAQSTLAGPIAANATSLTVASGDGAKFPPLTAGQYFVLTLYDAATQEVNEIMHVTAIVGDTFTIVRAQENTSARGLIAGDLVYNLLTAGSMIAVENILGFTPVQQGGGTSQTTQKINLGADTAANGLLRYSIAGTDEGDLASLTYLAANYLTQTAAALTYQPVLGYIPVHQGDGTGQGANVIRIGYQSAQGIVTLQVDATPFGNIQPFTKLQIFTASGTFSPSPNMVNHFVQIVGAGGGGAVGFGTGAGPGTTGVPGGGGGAGGYTEGIINLSGVASVAVSVGSGGAGSSGVGTAGSGAASTFGAYGHATGGGGGSNDGTAIAGGGLGGQGVGLQFITDGGDGSDGCSGIYDFAGNGGASYFGGGGRAGEGQGGGGKAWGSGGGGGYNPLAGTTSPGGNGANGLVLVWF